MTTSAPSKASLLIILLVFMFLYLCLSCSLSAALPKFCLRECITRANSGDL